MAKYTNDWGIKDYWAMQKAFAKTHEEQDPPQHLYLVRYREKDYKTIYTTKRKGISPTEVAVNLMNQYKSLECVSVEDLGPWPSALSG